MEEQGRSRLKMAAWLVGFFLMLLVAAFFLYPFLNEERYQEMRAQFEEEYLGGFSDPVLLDIESEELESRISELEEDREIYRRQRDSLEAERDSLVQETQRLQEELDRYIAEREELEERAGPLLADEGGDGMQVALMEEEFSERVKSLLNLDEEELSPIVNQLSTEQLLQLYQGAGSIQRESLLRSLSPERAAELMTEVML